MTVDQKYSPFNSQTQHSIKFHKRSFSFSNRTALLTVILVAVLLRLGSAFYQGNAVSNLPGIFDQISYDGLARRVLGGFGFSFAEGHWPATRAGEPTAHWSYLYTSYLIVIYKLFGISPLVARVIQALIAGIFQTILIWRIGTRLFNPTVGLIAAAWNSLYIYFFYYAGALITETFYITAILWTFDSALRLAAATEKQSWKRWFEFGLAIGVTVLLRQVFLIFLPFLFLWLWWNIKDANASSLQQKFHWSAVKGLSIAALTLVMLILPWTIRNQRVFGTFVLLNTNAGFAFFWGNHPVYGTEFVPLLPATGPNSYYELIPPEFRTLNEAELDKALLVEGLRFVIEDPVRYFWLSLSRTGEFFRFLPSADSSIISNVSRVGSFGVSLPFMILGVWITLTSKLKSSTHHQRSGILLLLLLIVVYVGIHLVSWALIRYRLPVDAILLIFAALSISTLFKNFLYSTTD